MKSQKSVLLPLFLIVLVAIFGFFAFAWYSSTDGGTKQMYFVEGDVKIIPALVGNPSVELVNIKTGTTIFPFTVQPVQEFCIAGACGGTNIIVSVDNQFSNLGSWSTGIASGPILRHFKITGVLSGQKEVHVTVLGDNSEIVAEKNFLVVVK